MLSNAVVNIHSIADFYLNLTAKHGDSITHLKLQKILYYSQAWHLAIKDSPLFSDDFEAWIHGPVNWDIYQRFKDYEYHPIPDQPISLELSFGTVRHLVAVFKAYGGRSALELELMTHKEPPWRKAREGCKPDESCQQIISKEEMKYYYRSRIA